jgi:hypothetical protein
MPDNLRKKLAARAKRALSKAIIASPSEKKSERLRKKLNRGLSDTRELPEDCRECSKNPCGKTINTCEEKMMIGRCQHCGVKVRYRFIFGEFVYLCPVCRSRKEYD